jgi:hypothetical protein
MEYLGNQELINLTKVGFLCSQRFPAEVVLKSYAWAKQQRSTGQCVVCGAHSQLEKDVFDILLKGNQPLILVLARGMKKKWDSVINNALAKNRLLIISPFDESIIKTTTEQAEIRNKFIIDFCDNMHIPYSQPNGMLSKLLENTH